MLAIIPPNMHWLGEHEGANRAPSFSYDCFSGRGPEKGASPAPSFSSY